MVPELRDVLVLVKNLPEKYQKKAAWALFDCAKDAARRGALQPDNDELRHTLSVNDVVASPGYQVIR